MKDSYKAKTEKSETSCWVVELVLSNVRRKEMLVSKKIPYLLNSTSGLIAYDHYILSPK